MENREKSIKLAINGGIGFGAKLNSKQLLTIAKYMNEDEDLEVTTFQQLYIEIPESKKSEVLEEFHQVGLHCYPVGNFVKSIRTCNFCKGEEEEGMPVAKQLNRLIAGKPVPMTVKVAYTGCPVGCGEPMLSDIGIMKMKDHYNVYIGGKAKGRDAEVGSLVLENLTPNKLYKAVENIIDRYAEMGKKREPFYKFIKRVDKELFVKQISNF